LDFAKNVLPPLEPKVFVMCKQIGETTKMVSDYQFLKTVSLYPTMYYSVIIMRCLLLRKRGRCSGGGGICGTWCLDFFILKARI
jgi:hypothetical protein